ncbi:GNAT family N-acetyltransferase [Epibacterium sp. SM1979]|uniref:GNAT family N-acetyltransferase n=1 Tax=Tritonibacter litoralis TaxID=2662264 RepID=A0A843YJN0_9RHOB|nr:GNAT family N-acetyltransferase [Tritonibacter litoralis]MQQ09855.1 GNAT family N-acetyltransferase [Tritonibacter litoralis]
MIDIRLADPAAPELRMVLMAHQRHAAAHCPEGVNYALDPKAMREEGLQFWAAFHEERAVGCGALLGCSDGIAEVKSVHVLEDMRGRGLARQIMVHLSEEAMAAGYHALVLETGSAQCPGYDAARGLYEALGYQYCEAFGDYNADPASVFMRLPLRRAA